ncbi:uncharacterized protein SPPG_06057 [Spizellomyces punctatus DAOM BR117]|uniref:Uncharacterized protein n=1 Tax=Spizellomyces punctatus (strain DAOM BR117) TaxID=645134 RepID=A0A0L0HC46_SPIPD|nr:uncharacterized protein SPPG_06057 [Spizellomyces punctatus DAOM BR117]KNC98348.1 hypothetical protein SPPG_06057 [Spizellomyces punctatus DAOM BR117]|eukprot:XP_016606388.1 hypothetical protein SPPG_06057 [Spizellomyces punctatus DAOM BR117]
MLDRPARQRIHRHIRTKFLLKKGANGGANDDDGDRLPELPPGQMQLHSFYAPALLSSPIPYKIDVTQVIEADSQQKLLKSTQTFEVVAPRFTLDATTQIHSQYPPNGHADYGTILPHVVLTDPHLPWERQPSVNAVPTEAGKERNRTPWLALVVFETSELQLPLATTPPLITFPSDVTPKQSSTMSINMTISQLRATQDIVHPLPANDSTIDPSTKLDVIFLDPNLFTALVSSSPASSKPNLDRYQHLAHSRNVNTKYTASSGLSSDNGTFSIVVSHRTGPLSLDKPTSCAVHLLSLEGWEDNITLPINSTAVSRVAVISLYSWNYTCLPPQSINFHQLMVNLGDEAKGGYGLLRNSMDRASPLIKDRLNDGYTLLRYRLASGDETIAFMRGPLTPTLVPCPLTPTWPTHSFFSTDLQILDTKLGVMDITYSAAWQLGRTLAIADQAFSAALMRLRSSLHSAAQKAVKNEIGLRLGTYKGKMDNFEALQHAVEGLKGLHNDTIGKNGPDHLRRWYRPLAQASSGNESSGKTCSTRSQTLFNEHNGPPNSSDWSLILTWLLDKLYLHNIPAHYLIPDPAFLGKESLRFFYIDRNWTDALIDGALSIANHMDPDDQVRTQIKEMLKTYLSTPIDPQIANYPPQLPVYGFLLRSAIVTAWPDLEVHAPWTDAAAQARRLEVIRLENIAKDTMLCLLDRAPQPGGQLQSIRLSQPAHQQYFELDVDAHEERAAMEVKFIDTINKGATSQTGTAVPLKGDAGKPGGYLEWKKGDDKPQVFNWDSRTVVLPSLEKAILDVLMPYDTIFKDDTMTAAYMGVQLNSPMLNLIFGNGEVRSSSAEIRVEHPASSVSPALSDTSGGVNQDSANREYLESKTSSKDGSLIGPAAGHNNGSLSSSLGATAIQFDYQCFDSLTGSLSVGQNSPKDLVFHITPRQAGAPTDWLFLEAKIKIPRGEQATDLILPYAGTGARMISNQRFNVKIEHESNYLVCRILPRSTRVWVFNA